MRSLVAVAHNLRRRRPARAGKTWLAASFVLGCRTPSDGHPNIPTEEELLKSATSICELSSMCFDSPAEDEIAECATIVRNEVAVDVYECDWLWIDINECLTSSTCQNYGWHDQYKWGTCSDEYQEWQDCRRELDIDPNQRD